MPRYKDPERYTIILNFINDYWQQNGVSPTTREISAGTGIPNGTVGRYLVDLKAQGRIIYDGRRDFRTKEQETQREGTRVHVVGSIACGLPKLAEQNIEDYVYLPKKLIGSGKFYLLRANGDSMIQIGIHTGDLVLIRAQNVAEYGQVVVAQVGNEEATLKTYRPNLKKGIVALHPENDAMEDIVVDVEKERLAIQGVAKEVIHRLP